MSTKWASDRQSGLFACVAAVAANKLQRPIKLRLDRDDDFMITGRRHCFWYEYEVGFRSEVGPVRLRGGGGGQQAAAPHQAAAGPRRRLHDHRPPPLLLV